MDLLAKLEKLRDELDPEARVIFNDMLWKLARRDWHGVADAACDMRVLEATRSCICPHP